MIAEGFQEIDVSAAWREILEAGYERRVQALAMVDVDDWQVASQLGERRRGSGPPTTTVTSNSSFKVIELSDTLLPYARAQGQATDQATRTFAVFH